MCQSPRKRLLNIIVEKVPNPDECFCPFVVIALREYANAMNMCIFDHEKWIVGDEKTPRLQSETGNSDCEIFQPVTVAWLELLLEF